MMTKVFDLLRSLGWYLIKFIYDLIDALLSIIKKLNAFDIISSLSNNQAFRTFYSGVMAIAITLFALVIVWRFINKILDPDEDASIKTIMVEIAKCGALIMLSTFLFVQVSNFSIKLANYTGSIFETSTNSTMSKTMLGMFISYKDNYKNSDKFKESKTIKQLIDDDSFDKDELYIDKYVTKSRIILSDKKDYKYEINWLMAVICGGFFLYSLFFAGIMLGRRQIEFLFLFCISPIVFATSVCNKQRRGAVIEQLVSLALQSAVVMVIVSLSVMVMQEVNVTTFFKNHFMDITTKSLLYIGCATFILTGSQVINRFIGNNVSANSGREQLMSLMGYGKMAGIGATIGAGALAGGGLLATGEAIKGTKYVGSHATSQLGSALTYAGTNISGEPKTRIQELATSIGAKMTTAGYRGLNKNNNSNKFTASDAFINAGASSLNNAVRKVMPRASYNPSYYRRRKNIL